MPQPPERTARSFRLTCADREIPLVEDLLRAQGFVFEPEPFSPLCRRAVVQPRPLGSSLAAYFGLIYIQDRSSMLPPLMLAPPPGAAVLDMCASPGGKTGFLAQLAGPDGFVLANEPSRDRLETLRANMNRTCAATVATCGYPGQNLPLPDGCFTHILCDAPCSGWGTADKNPKALSVWREDKVQPLVSLQRELLAEAARLLAPGGRLLYSTCTTNPAENEDQTRFTLDSTDLALDPLTPPPGFAFHDPPRQELAGVLRVDGQASEAQGFYLAAFTKPGQADNQPELPIHPDPGPSGLNLAGLPPGMTQQFDRRLFFLPRRAAPYLSPTLKLRGYHIATASGGIPRLQARARLLLPEFSPENGLNSDDPDQISRLIAGQSLNTSLDLPRPGLYFKGLKLGWLTRKGARLLWSDR